MKPNGVDSPGASRGRPVALAIMALAGAVAIASMTPVQAEPAPAASQVAQKRYQATRPLVIDRQTGKARLPTQAELAQTIDSLATLAQRESSGLAQSVTTGGAVAVDLDGGFGGVMLARPGADGGWETRCVFTLEEGVSFLGLVEVAE